MIRTDAEDRFRVKGWHVLMAVTGFFAVVIGVDTTFAVLAMRTFPGEVSVTPYEDGLVYNRKLAQLSAQERLGWRVIATAQADGILLRLEDRAGAPISGLTVSGKLERPATETGRITLAFRETAPGLYHTSAGRLAGAWDLTASAVDLQGHRFEAERRLWWR